VVVMLTSISQCHGMRNQVRCDAYLVKPVRHSQLLQTIAAAWAKRRGAERGWWSFMSRASAGEPRKKTPPVLLAGWGGA
jgi:hypothetical protein